MESLNTIKLADELTIKQDDILADTAKLNADAIYQLIDELKVLKHPIQEYFEMSQDEYYSSESDHQLTLLDMNNKLVDLHDRILTNHVEPPDAITASLGPSSKLSIASENNIANIPTE